MDTNLLKTKGKRYRRQMRVRKHVRGTAEKPRLSVFKSNKHVSAQLIDDENHITLAGYGTMSDEFDSKSFVKKSKEAARQVGKKIAALAKEKNVDRVVFDRGRYKFHGVIAELANAAREAGLQF